jgi:hypothetical protein
MRVRSRGPCSPMSVRGPGDVYDVIAGGYWKVNIPPAQYGTWVNGPQTTQGMATVKMPSPDVLKLFDAELARPPRPEHPLTPRLNFRLGPPYSRNLKEKALRKDTCFLCHRC